MLAGEAGVALSDRACLHHALRQLEKGLRRPSLKETVSKDLTIEGGKVRGRGCIISKLSRRAFALTANEPNRNHLDAQSRHTDLLIGNQAAATAICTTSALGLNLTSEG